MRTETVVIDEEFGGEYAGKYVFQELTWAKRSRIIQKYTKYHSITGQVVSSDYIAIQAETIMASLKEQPQHKPVTLEKLLGEEEGIPIALGELFSQIVNRLNNVSLEETAFLSELSERKSHVINSASGAGTNYQVKVIVHYGSGTDSGADVYLNGHCRTDFGDVRFTDDDGETLLDYWMESKVDSDYAIFWVEVADDLSSNSATIYVYYGKSDATTTSNGANTFLYFNHFDVSEDFTEEDGTWQLDTANSMYKYVTGGSGQVQSYKDIARTANDGYRTRCRHKSSAQKDNGFYTRYTNGYAYGGIYVGKGSAGANDVGGYGENTWTQLYSVSSPTGTAWHISEALNYGQKYVAYTDGVQRYSGDVDFHLTSTKIALAAWAGYYAEFDWIFVAKYVCPEPAHGSWGSEETSGAATITVADTLGFSDMILCNRAFAVIDNVGLSEIPLRDWTSQVSDNLNLSESPLTSKILQLLDSFPVSDNALVNKHFEILDVLNLNELANVILAGVLRQVLDNLSLTDQALTNKILVSLDALALSENALTDRQICLPEELNLTEHLAVSKIFNLTDEVSLIETIERDVAGTAKTRLFLVLGDLAIQLTR